MLSTNYGNYGILFTKYQVVKNNYLDYQQREELNQLQVVKSISLYNDCAVHIEYWWLRYSLMIVIDIYMYLHIYIERYYFLVCIGCFLMLVINNAIHLLLSLLSVKLWLQNIFVHTTPVADSVRPSSCVIALVVGLTLAVILMPVVMLTDRRSTDN